MILRSIRYSNQGPEASSGLQLWDPIPKESLISGDPVQSGHVYHSDDTGQLTSGVWHCTPMVAKPGPYDVNEFMLVLDGAITLEYANGDEETFNVGEGFVIPKGTPLSWKQTGDVLKYWVIFEDNSGEELDAAELVARRIDPGTALEPVGEQDTSRYVGGVPEQGIRILFEDATRQMICGVWQTSEMHTKPAPFPRNELMHILEGECDDHRRFRPCRDLFCGRHVHGSQGRHLPVGQHRNRPQDLLHLPGKRGGRGRSGRRVGGWTTGLTGTFRLPILAMFQTLRIETWHKARS